MKQSPLARHHIVGYSRGSDRLEFEAQVADESLLPKYVQFDAEDPNGFDSYELDYDRALTLAALVKGQTLRRDLDYFLEVIATELSAHVSEPENFWTVTLTPEEVAIVKVLLRRHRNTKIEELRETYGAQFAEGIPGSEMLTRILLPKLDQGSIHRLIEGSLEITTGPIRAGRVATKRRKRPR
jgi:hypothetical protein